MEPVSVGERGSVTNYEVGRTRAPEKQDEGVWG